MRRRPLHVALGLLAAAACALAAERYELANEKVLLAVDGGGRLLELTNRQTGHRYLATTGHTPPWRMFYKTGSYRTGEAIDVEIPSDGQKCQVRQEGSTLTLSYPTLTANLPHQGHTREFRVGLVLRISLKDDQLIWTTTIDNREKDVEVSEIWIAWINGIGNMGLGREADVLYWPESAGRRIEAPFLKLTGAIPARAPGAGRRLQMTYPFPASMAWFTFNNGAEGLSFASHDKTLMTSCLNVTADRKQGLAASIVKYAFVKTGETWRSEPVVVRLYRGDWHVAALAYRAWAETWMQKPNAPSWIRRTPGWAHTALGRKGQSGDIAGSYSDYPLRLKDARVLGINVLMTFGWTRQGFDNRYPEYAPDETLGGAEGLKEALARVKQAGGKQILYTQGHLIDPATDFYRAKGHRMTAVDVWGGEYREQYSQPVNGTFLAAMNNKYFAPACQSAPGWYEQLASQIEMIQGFGAQGMIFDQLGGQTPYICFSSEHGHNKPSLAAGPGKLANLRRLREVMKSRDPEFAFVVELLVDCYAGWVDIINTYGMGCYPAPESFGEMFRYTFPDSILTNRVSGVVSPDLRTFYGHAFSLGLRVDTRRGEVNDPVSGPYLARLGELRNSLADLLLEGRFVDNEGFVCDNSLVPAHAFLAGDRMAVVLWNPGEVPRAAKVRAPGYVLEQAKWQNPDWSGPGHTLMPKDVAVFVFRRR